MTYKRIEYSPHAARRMQERGIRSSDVKQVLATGTMFVPGQYGGAVRHGRRDTVRDEGCLVIYIEDALHILVVTVMWEK